MQVYFVLILLIKLKKSLVLSDKMFHCAQVRSGVKWSCPRGKRRTMQMRKQVHDFRETCASGAAGGRSDG